MCGVRENKMIQYIDADYLGTRYCLSDFTTEPDLAIPWGEVVVDCQIFPPAEQSSSAMPSHRFQFVMQQNNSYLR